MENQQLPEEPIKQQKSYKLPIQEDEKTESNTEEVSREENLTIIEGSEIGESTQKIKSHSLPEQDENLLSESLTTSELAKLFQSLQDGFHSIIENFQPWEIKIEIKNQLQMENTKLVKLRSYLKEVIKWLENLKIGNRLMLSDIETVVKVINETDALLASYSSLIQKHQNLKEKADNLENDCKKYEKKVSFSQQKYNHLSQSFQQIQENINDLQRDNERLSQDNKILKSDNSKLQNQLMSLKQERDTLKNEREQLENERSRMLRDLAAKNRDKNTTYTIFTDKYDSPQHHTLYPEFKQLKDQDFNAFSNEMFHYLCEQELALKANRKQAIAKIKSVLSKQIMMNGMKLFIEPSNFSDEKVENALKTVSRSFRMASGIAEDAEIPETFSNELENLIKQGMELLNETRSAGTNRSFRNQEKFTTVIKDISKSVYNALNISEEKDIPEQIRIDTENLVRKGLELVNKIASADPPGILWIEKEGIPFKSDRHEAMLGCQEGGKILLTVYPGYLVGDRVFEKALVFTVLEESV